MLKIKNQKFIILSGPSGVGKTQISKALEKRVPSLKLVVATTSRQPRENEINGKDYYFISENGFKKIISDKGFLEWAKIGDFYYGIELNNCSSGLCLLNIDYQGMEQVKKNIPIQLQFLLSLRLW